MPSSPLPSAVTGRPRDTASSKWPKIPLRGKGDRDVTTRICETRRRPSKSTESHVTGSHRAQSHRAALRKLVSAELENLPRVKAERCPRAAYGSFVAQVLTAVHHEKDRERAAKGAAEALRNRCRLSRWNERDRRVQRLRGWLSGAAS